MKIAITGATGNLGRSLTEYFLKEGHSVVALGRNKIICSELEKLGAEVKAGEISDQAYLDSSFKNCDVVIHSAGLASPWGKYDAFYESNVIGTKNVLSSMEKNNIKKLVHLSSPSVYFSGEPFFKITEDAILPQAKNHYSKTKILADELVIHETKNKNLNSILLRPRSIIGKYDNVILPRVLRIMKKGFFPLPNGGSAIVDITAVENVVHVVDLFLKSQEHFSAEIFNISNEESISVKDLTQKLALEMKLKVRFVPVPAQMLYALAKVSETAALLSGKEPALTKYALQSLAVSQTLSIEKLKSRLGYKKVIDLNTAIKNFANSH